MGPTVTLEFKGDESSLTKAVGNVGKATKSMADDVGSASNDIRSHSKAFGVMEEGTDKAEKKFTGFKDVLDGGSSALATLQDSSLSTTEKLIAFGQAGADMAGGLADFLIPAIASLTTLLRGGLASAMSFIAAHPLMIALLALAAVFVLLWTRSETFRDIVIGVFSAVAGFIKSVFGSAIEGIKIAWDNVIGFFGTLPSRIGAALGGLASAIGGAFKGALNVVIDFLNWWVDRINAIIRGINIINPFSDIPSVPHIGRLHTGIGTVPGGPGTESAYILQAGEKVSRASEGGVVTLVVEGGDNSWLYQQVSWGLRTGKIKPKGGSFK